MDEKLLKKISIGFIGLSVIVNAFSFMYLPSRIGIHVNSSGVVDNYIPKTIYVLVTPAIIIAIFILSCLYKYSNKMKMLMGETILFILNLWIIFSQIKI